MLNVFFYDAVWRMSFHLNAVNRDITGHIEVFKAVVSEAVWKADHFAVWEFDVKLLIVEVNHQLVQRRTNRYRGVKSVQNQM